MTFRMKTISQLIFSAAMLLGLASVAQAADIEAGKAKAEQLCAACHSADGSNPIPGNPKLAGQYADYLELTLKGYRSGERPNPIMAGMAAALTDEDIANLAAWFAPQSGLSVLSKDPVN